jgi:hypothetical protein
MAAFLYEINEDVQDIQLSSWEFYIYIRAKQVKQINKFITWIKDNWGL